MIVANIKSSIPPESWVGDEMCWHNPKVKNRADNFSNKDGSLVLKSPVNISCGKSCEKKFWKEAVTKSFDKKFWKEVVKKLWKKVLK